MKFLIVIVALFGFLGLGYAEETLTEKVQVPMNTTKRMAKKGMHRAAEAVCGKLTGSGKLECLAKEAKNRVEEGSDALKDAGSEIKNNVDSDKK